MFPTELPEYIGSLLFFIKFRALTKLFSWFVPPWFAFVRFRIWVMQSLFSMSRTLLVLMRSRQ